MRIGLIGLGLIACLMPSGMSAGGIVGSSVTAQLQVFPTQPRAGQSATIQLRPYRLLSGQRVPVVISPNHRWRVTAVRYSTRRPVSPRFSRDATDPYVWTARFRFGAVGRWVLRIGGDRSDTSLKIRVLHRGSLGTWARLERPFHTPTIASGTTCPTSTRDPKGDLSRIGYRGPAWGVGPGYPVISFDQERPTLYYQDPIPPESVIYGSKWFGQKVLWVVDRQTYRGPILIRGRQVDGLHEIRFELARVPVVQMTISRLVDNQPSTTRTRTRGCYAYQVDGIAFSSVIVFEARPFSSQ